jgi:hypothetical protein
MVKEAHQDQPLSLSLSLAGCSSAKLASVSTRQGNILNELLYLHSIKKDSHLQ